MTNEDVESLFEYDDPITSPEESTIDESPQEPLQEVEKDEISSSYFNFLKEYKVLDTPDDFEFDGSPEKLEEALNTTKESLSKKAYQAL